MSADLFAAFEAPAQAPRKSQQNSASPASQYQARGMDPFSFLQAQPAPSHSQPVQQATQWTSSPTPQPPGGLDIWGDLSGLSQPVSISQSQAADEDEDGWGDFEAPTQETVPKHPVRAVSPPRLTRIVRAPTLDLMSNNLLDLDSSSQRPEKVEQLPVSPSWPSSVKQSTKSRPEIADPNVLFDADDFDEGALPGEDEDDDDFGDFEAAAPASAPAAALDIAPIAQASLDWMSTRSTSPPSRTRQAPPSQLLSTLSFDEGPSAYPQPPKSPSFKERNPLPGLGIKTPVSAEFPKDARPSSPVTAWPSFESEAKSTGLKEKNSFEADWGAFDDIPPKPTLQVAASKRLATRPAEKKATATTTTANDDWGWDDWGTSTVAEPPGSKAGSSSPKGPPPTNIPPPSVLLSIFPSLLSAVSTSLFKSTATAPYSVKDKVHSAPATITFLRGYLALATVAARIIAGRKLRWHRDKFLSQSMTISAATGGKGGMKLAGIDKSQSAREDRDAADVTAAWKDIVGRLRTAVAAANATIARDPASLGMTLKVPELTETMRVETLKGALTAPKACVVCGLKRDERVARVEFEVEDSFGEWWVEFWGHRECRNFWLEHEAALRSR